MDYTMSPPASDLLLEELKDKLAPFCRRHRVATLELFGSAARGGMRPDSDLDFLVIFQPGVRLGWDFVDLGAEMESILGREVDLLTRRSVEMDPNPIRRREILLTTRQVYAA
jgi:predicted nucleotidyltransferase